MSIYWIIFFIVVAGWVSMEAWFTLSRGKATKRDKTLWLIWSLNFTAILIAIILRPVSFARIPLKSNMLTILGTIIILAGLILRIWAIRTLGKFFEPTVVIKPDQPIIKTGPYKYIRHPSYSGGYLSFIGCGVALGNWIGLIIIMISVFIGFSNRIKQEEKILIDGFGEEYRSYIKTTKKLIPLVY